MASKSSPAPKPALPPTAKPPKSKTSTNEPKTGQENDGIERASKSSKPQPTIEKPRRKPRKLNKDAPSTPAPETTNVSAQDPTAELDALKSRVRGLEAKVEALYESNTSTNSKPIPPRSPRRRGKGRKASSSTQTPTLNTLAETSAPQGILQGGGEEEDEEADEELVRLEGELETARQDLESYPLSRRTDAEDDGVEEIPRGGIARTTTIQGDKQVTLSGSYRIPIPTNVSVQDVQTIKSGVSAAQNVARSFLEQRRAAAASRGPVPSSQQQSASASARPAASSSVGEDVDAGDKQSWGDWIGGYSLAITRAVKSIEHEAAVESQRGAAQGRIGGRRQSGGKRPTAKAKMSSEQVHGLMS